MPQYTFTIKYCNYFNFYLICKKINEFALMKMYNTLLLILINKFYLYYN